MGCKMVYEILMTAAESFRPEEFRNSDLYKECVAKGIIPSYLSRSNSDDHSFKAESAEKESSLVNLQPKRSCDGHLIELKLIVRGMWCPACAWVISHLAAKIHGVFEAACYFERDLFVCKYNPVLTSPQDIKKNIRKIGYDVSETLSGYNIGWENRELLRLVVSALLSMNIMMLSVALYTGFFSKLSGNNIWYISSPVFIMSCIVIGYGGAPVFRKAFSGLLTGFLGMEALISIGTFSSFTFSIYSFLKGDIHLYFDTGCMLITLTLLGKYLERKTKSVIFQDMASLLDLFPQKARRITKKHPDGRYIKLDQLTVGDLFRVVEDELVPADGIIVKGKGSICFSSVTGEPEPVQKMVGDRVLSGSKIKNGELTVRCEKNYGNSFVGQLSAAVEEVLAKKDLLEGKTDLILKWSVPFIVFLSLATLLNSLFFYPLNISVNRALSVLVISCPCALGIAVPLIRVAGVFLCLKKGILIKDYSVFETAMKIDTLVLDKTGTLTEGKWNLKDFTITDCFFEKEEVLDIALGLERNCDHPVASEIRRMAYEKKRIGASIRSHEICDRGVSGLYNNHTVRIGSLSFLKEAYGDERGLVIQDSCEDEMASSVYLAIDGKVTAAFRFGDKIRESSYRLVSALREKKSIHLLSGDDSRVTEYVGRLLGIEGRHGDMLPQDKSAFVEKLRKNGRKVAMIGDGMNDALALAASDLSIGLYSGYPLGKDTAQVTIIGGDPVSLTFFFDFSEKIRRKMSQNLYAAFFYNILSIPVAMSGMLSPLFSVTAMLLSSLSVTLNVVFFVKSYGKE